MSKLVLHNIHSVAKYESKLLTRSWFYRIFLILAILFLFIYNFLALVSTDTGGFWLMQSLPSNIPYVNLMFLNAGQAIIAVFLSSEFLKSDKKLDTSEVFYVHPLSNAEYVIGKIWGNVRVFFRMDIIIMLLVVVFNIISGLHIDWNAYVIYFLLICIPTLIYIFGLSIGLMLLLKSQAVTFIILLGYIVLTLFYIGDTYHYLFDYMAFNLPMMKSEIVGFTSWSVLINQRLIYLLLGIGFIFLSIFLFKRLPNTKRGKYFWLAASLIFITAGLSASYNYVDNFNDEKKNRQLYIELNNQYVSTPRMLVDYYDINLQQQPNLITSEVSMRSVAQENAKIFTFCLNPGLRVTEVRENNKKLPFTRDQQILLINFEREVQQGDTVWFNVKYEGIIDESFSYLDIPPEILQEQFKSGMFKIDKKYSFQEENYLLFTPESYWYPRPGTSYSSENPDWQQAYFSNFRLKVTTINNLIALSQGTMKYPVATEVTAFPAEPTDVDDAQIVSSGIESTEIKTDRDSLRRIHDRDRDTTRTFNRDSIRRERPNRGEAGVRDRERGGMERGRGMQRMEGPQRYAAQSENRGDSFNSDAETVRESNQENQARVITEVIYDSVFVYETDFLTPYITLIIGDYEQKSVEVDETLYSIWHIKGHDYFSQIFNSITDTIPSQIRERRRSIETGYSLDYSFNRFSLIEVPVQFYSYSRTWTQAQEVMQPEMVLMPEKGSLINEADVVRGVRNEKNYAQRRGQEISDEVAAMRVLNRFMWLFEQRQSSIDWSQDRGTVNVSVNPNPFFVFPQLYNFRYNVFSSEWPISNRLIELYLQEKSDDSNWMRQMNGISNNEKANLLMEQQTFKELLSNIEYRDLLDNIISLKGDYLFAHVEQNIGYRESRDSLRAVLQRNVFTNIRFENLLDTMAMIGDTELHSHIESWNYPNNLPVYVMGTPEVTHISNRGEEAYVVKLQITNDSDYDGIIDVEINFGGWQRSAIYDPREKRKVPLKAHETKNLVSVWDEAPRAINVNTLISANLPVSVNLAVNNILREINIPIDEEGDYVVENGNYDIPGEVIVDNEDSTLFLLSEPEVVGLLPQLLDQVDETSFRYSGVSGWRPPLQWTLTTHDKYYGTHIRSAYVIKSGSGSQTATWRIPVPGIGEYDLYYWVQKPDELRRGRGRRGRTGGDPEYNFKVRYDESEENAYINLQRADEGWSILGTYFFSDDTVEVVLSDDSRLRTVTADAVKIVRR